MNIDQPIKAIETSYAGFRFRSRTEARWAVFLDGLDLAYEYEKEGYRLKSGIYLPDFFIPEWKCWLEIKGSQPSGDERRLCEELADVTDRAVVLCHGLPNANFAEVYCADCTDSGGGLQWWDDVHFGHRSGEPPRPCLCNMEHCDQVYLTPGWNTFASMADPKECFVNDGVTQCAALIAKRARFEFGDTPTPISSRDATMALFWKGVRP